MGAAGSRHGRAGAWRHPRFQPWLLVIATVAVLPLLAARSAPWSLWVVAAACLLLALITWARPSRPGFTPVVRDRWGLATATGATIGFATVLATVGADTPESFLLLGTSLIAAMASARSRLVRWGFQAAVTLSLVAVMLGAGRPVLDVVAPVALLLAVAVLSDLFVGHLRTARGAELAARADAERRAELLEAVTDLPDATPPVAIRRVVATVRSLGFDAAAVLLHRDDALVAAEVAGSGAALRACTEVDPWVRERGLRRPSVQAPSGEDPTARVAAPIQLDGESVGVLLGTRAADGEPSPADVEIVEVLADHLGVVLATERHIRRQQDLLDRMERLERMRSSFVAAVSTELRDPLTVVRSVGEILAARADTVDAPRRSRLLQRMCEETDELRQTIDALLDFSRLHATRLDAQPVAVGLRSLLDPVARTLGGDVRYLDLEVTPSTAVRVDVGMVRHALELAGATTAGGARSDLLVSRTVDEVRISVATDLPGPPPSTLVRALVAQLLVAGGAALAADTELVAVLPAAYGEVGA